MARLDVTQTPKEGVHGQSKWRKREAGRGDYLKKLAHVMHDRIFDLHEGLKYERSSLALEQDGIEDLDGLLLRCHLAQTL